MLGNDRFWSKGDIDKWLNNPSGIAAGYSIRYTIRMCGRVNVSDHPAIQSLMKEMGLPLYPEQDFHLSAKLFPYYKPILTGFYNSDRVLDAAFDATNKKRMCQQTNQPILPYMGFPNQINGILKVHQIDQSTFFFARLNVIISWQKLIITALMYQSFTFGSFLPGHILSIKKKITVAQMMRNVGSVMFSKFI